MNSQTFPGNIPVYPSITQKANSTLKALICSAVTVKPSVYSPVNKVLLSTLQLHFRIKSMTINYTLFFALS